MKCGWFQYALYVWLVFTDTSIEIRCHANLQNLCRSSIQDASVPSPGTPTKQTLQCHEKFQQIYPVVALNTKGQKIDVNFLANSPFAKGGV